MEPIPSFNFSSFLGPKLYKGTESVDTNFALKNTDIVGAYFGANWCPPCGTFLPILKERYQKLREAGKKFEIIFIGSCESQEEHNKYYESMPWLSLPFDSKRINDNISGMLQITGIPCLALFEIKTEEWITTNAERFIEKDDY